MMSMLDAVAFMHSKGVIHRDLKLENFVFAEKGNLNSLSVVDFGLAKALNARQKAQHVCGTLSYISPEALLAGVYGQGVDVWALGVAMHVCSRLRGRRRRRRRRTVRTDHRVRLGL